MSLRKPEPERPPTLPCVRCARAPQEREVWSQKVCDECYRDWSDEAPASGEAERLASPEQLERARAEKGFLSVFYREWTAAWVRRFPRLVAAS